MIQTFISKLSPAVLNFLVICLSASLGTKFLKDGYDIYINPVAPISSAILNTNRISTKVPVLCLYLIAILIESYLNYSNKQSKIPRDGNSPIIGSKVILLEVI
jgi:hypothetical protein